MAVAETTLAQDRTPQRPYADLGWKSLAGAVFVLLSCGAVLTGLPTLWNEILQVPVILGNELLSGALLLLVCLILGIGLFFVGRILELSQAQPGLRAGTMFISVYVLFLMWIVSWLGPPFQQLGGLGAILLLGGVGALGFLAIHLLHRPGFCQWLTELEEQGWFHAISYKGNQGIRVRRGTIMALLVLGGGGVLTLHGMLSRGTDWVLWIPFLGDASYGYYLPLLYTVKITLPILLGFLVIWFAWRVTNWPTFADFLIATEAEMNKVSWTSRRRLMQDTVVVLTTVLILTAYLFIVDWAWIKILESPWINVLQLNPQDVQRQQQEKSQW